MQTHLSSHIQHCIYKCGSGKIISWSIKLSSLKIILTDQKSIFNQLASQPPAAAVSLTLILFLSHAEHLSIYQLRKHEHDRSLHSAAYLRCPTSHLIEERNPDLLSFPHLFTANCSSSLQRHDRRPLHNSIDAAFVDDNSILSPRSCRYKK